MKKLLAVTVLGLFVFSGLSYSQDCSKCPSKSSCGTLKIENKVKNTVYIGIDSKLFHKKDCKLNTGKTGIIINEAKKKGYKPCKVCFPPKKIKDKNSKK